MTGSTRHDVHRKDRRVGQPSRGRIRNLADVARLRLRFVNRERGSGTRLLFDALLASQRLKPSEIVGYDREEFTHMATAATVRAGMADVAFGIEAAARRTSWHSSGWSPSAITSRAAAVRRRASPLIRWWQRRAVMPSAARSRAWADTIAMPRETGCTSPTFSADGSRTEARPFPRTAGALDYYAPQNFKYQMTARELKA